MTPNNALSLIKKLIIALFLILLTLLGWESFRYLSENPVDRVLRLNTEDARPSREKAKHYQQFIVASQKQPIDIPYGTWETQKNSNNVSHRLEINDEGGFVWSIFGAERAIGMSGYFEIIGHALIAHNAQGQGRVQIPENGNVIVEQLSDKELRIIDHASMKPLIFKKVMPKATSSEGSKS